MILANSMTSLYNLHFVTGLYGMPDTMQMVTQRGYNGVDLDGTVILGWQDKHAASRVFPPFQTSRLPAPGWK